MKLLHFFYLFSILNLQRQIDKLQYIVVYSWKCYKKKTTLVVLGKAL